jgi:SAM-dependent methyltransferase
VLRTALKREGCKHGSLYAAARDIKNAIPVVREAWALARRLIWKATHRPDTSYAGRITAETAIYRDVADIHELPPIFHYWSNRHLRPMLETFGFSNPDQLFAKHLHESAARRGVATPAFLSIGAGNCDTEIRVSRLMRDAGLSEFTIECLDLNPAMLARGREMAEREGVGAHIVTTEGDFNRWRASRTYDGIIANQSLHHVVNLEGLLAEVRRGLAPRAFFIVDDMIGRNGHMRWPEALAAVRRFWRELPSEYRYNRQLERHEPTYRNHDCSTESFEGVRAADILPLLVERFRFHLFIGFANVVDVFVDRAFGHSFDAEAEWDRNFIDRVHAFDEQGFAAGTLTPTHMMAVMTVEPDGEGLIARGLGPAASVRQPRILRSLRRGLARRSPRGGHASDS